MAVINTKNSKFRIGSFNCRGLNISKKFFIADVLMRKLNCQFIFLQEHWLSDGQLDELNSISINYLSVGVSGFNNSDVLKGRPYGGCAILWKRDVCVKVTAVPTNSLCICAARVDIDDVNLLFINVYMPYEDNGVRTAAFLHELSVLEDLIECHADSYIVIGGDWNVDFTRSSWSHTESLNKFCVENNLFPTVQHVKSSVDFTYHFNMQRFSILDHFLVCGLIFDSSVLGIHAYHDVDNCSDHEPLILDLDIDVTLFSTAARRFIRKTAWYKATADDILCYEKLVSQRVPSIDIPTDALLCHDLHCTNPSHTDMLEKYYCDIVDVCLTSAVETIPVTGSKGRISTRHVPGWTEYVEPQRCTSKFWHDLWADCGRPKIGVVADIMRRTRAMYHYALRSVRKIEADVVKERFASAVLRNNDRDLWAEVKKMRAKNSRCSSVVDDNCTDASIADFFSKKYEDLYTSVPYDIADMNDLKCEVKNNVSAHYYGNDCVVTVHEVTAALCRLRNNKNDGNKGLTSDHVKSAGSVLCTHIALLLSGVLVHGFVPEDMLISIVTPIPKGKNTNVTDSANYRGIALSSVLGKILDLIVLSRYEDLLATSDLQFGFKAKRSTAMCTMVLKETIEYYINNGNTVYCTFLDASKAFDRVKYCKLFRLLIERHLPPVIVRILLYMYTNHSVRVSWNGVTSSSFLGGNGVKQGGVISPVLFCVYLDGLLYKLQSAGYGCHIGLLFLGVLAYADDIVLIAPTCNAMRHMLQICEEFANDMSLLFNAKKSKCIVLKPNYGLSCAPPRPTFQISGAAIEIVEQWPHLGHIITEKYRDDRDIMNRCHILNGQINNVISYFRNVNSFVKIRLLKSYCSSLYGCELWNLYDGSIDKVCVAWRKGLRNVFHLPLTTSCVVLDPLSGTIPLFDEICRRFLLFATTCLHSDCGIVAWLAKYAINVGQMHSPMGRNNLFCYERYNRMAVLRSNSVSVDPRRVRSFCESLLSENIRLSVHMIQELIMLREQFMFLPGHGLDSSEIEAILTSLCCNI